MSIWGKVFQSLITKPPVVDTATEEKLAKGLQRFSNEVHSQYVPTSLGSDGKKSDIDKMFQRGISFSVLREFADYYPILRSCINYRKRQITQLQWGVSPKEVVTNDKQKAQYKKDAEGVLNFFKNINGDKTSTFRDFLNKILEDLLVLDAVAVYKRLNRRGSIYGYLPIDATSIQLALYADGTTPLPPDPAYVQKINGQKITELTTDELIYRMMNPRTNSPYGQSPIESLIITVTTALKLSTYNLAYLTEGNVPEGFVELPKEVASDPDQLTLWQQAWDAMFSGNPSYQRKIKFLPEGMKLHEIRKQDDMGFQRFEQWLLLSTCSAMEVAPQAIGFQFERGKGATEMEWEIGKERALFPTANLLKEIFDSIIENDLKQPHLEFVWTNLNPTNKQEEAKVFETLVKYGAVSVDEWRVGEGMEPIGLGPFIQTSTGVVLVEDLINRTVSTVDPDSPFVEGKDPKSIVGDGKKEIPKEQPPKEENPPKKEPDETEKMVLFVEELKKWKKAASNDFKQGKSFRDFKSQFLDYRTQKIIKDGLKSAKTRQDINLLFDPFIGSQNQILEAVTSLYDEVNSLIDYHDTKKSATSS